VISDFIDAVVRNPCDSNPVRRCGVQIDIVDTDATTDNGTNGGSVREDVRPDLDELYE
jgi:hypothetical protein